MFKIDSKLVNSAVASGFLSGDVTFSHPGRYEDFWRSKLIVPRKSGISDSIPLLIPDHLLPYDRKNIVSVKGDFRSRNEENHLDLFMFVKNLSLVTGTKCNFTNDIQMTGYICKPPVYRATPLGRQISDVLLAVNTTSWHSDYIPCIFWGKSAKSVSKLPVGSELKITGRMQSREYMKRTPDTGEIIFKTAFEISVSEYYCMK